jgi:2-polyprenyl-3-methyl-5-hydroxy-6-metoxy-1,4-benzoquinol methylase
MNTQRLSYNERLFSSGLRGLYHTLRYRWVADEIAKLKVDHARIVDLGCYDGKTVKFLKKPPAYYLGLDANWEDGLEIGRRLWADHPEVELVACRHPEDIPARDPFDIGICMETMEHLPDDILTAYVQSLSQIVTGKLFITVPVERGPMFLMKYLAKSLTRSKGKAKYTIRDVFNLTFSRTNAVQRNEHKGFDERKLIKVLKQHFTIDRVCGVFPGIPLASANLTVGIIASPKPSAQNQVKSCVNV